MPTSFRTRKRGTPRQIGKKFPVMEKKKLPAKITGPPKKHVGTAAVVPLRTATCARGHQLMVGEEVYQVGTKLICKICGSPIYDDLTGKELSARDTVSGGKLSKKFVVKKYVQSRKKPPIVVDNIYFSTEEEALNFYRRMKLTSNWPWTFYAYPEEVGHSIIPEPSQDREKQIRESYEKFKKEHGIKSGGKRGFIKLSVDIFDGDRERTLTVNIPRGQRVDIANIKAHLPRRYRESSQVLQWERK